ncbi:MAG: biopolymer transporter ExbD [Thermodesulfobacteriota bacterium]
MAFSTSRHSRSAMAEINVTPLVDVMLVLLIIFMVTAPMMQEGVKVEPPETEPGSPIEKEQTPNDIIISVDNKGSVYLSDKEIPEKDLMEQVTARVKGNLRQDVYLRADKSVPYGIVVRVMASLRKAGIHNLVLITNPKEEAAQSQ